MLDQPLNQATDHLIGLSSLTRKAVISMAITTKSYLREISESFGDMFVPCGEVSISK